MRRTIVVFVLLLGVVALAYFALSNAGATDEEAGDPLLEQSDRADLVDRFQEIDGHRIAALEQRDFSLVTEDLTATSPMRARLVETIQRLRRQDVVVDELSKTQSTNLLSQTADSASIEVEIIDNRIFHSESGKPVESKGQAEHQTIHCTLRLVIDIWKLHECTITNVGAP